MSPAFEDRRHAAMLAAERATAATELQLERDDPPNIVRGDE